MSASNEPRWDISHLRLLEQIVAEGSLTRVAALTGSPQPAVSRKLSKFESECGGKLFLRTGRGLELSELGKQIYPRAQVILRESELLSRDIVSRAAAPSGEVRLGVLASLCDVLLVRLFEDLQSRFPGIVLNITEGSAGQIEQWLSSGLVDVGVSLRYGSRKSTDYEPLAMVDAYLAGSPDSPLTRHPEVKFSALNGAPLILPSAPSATRLLINQLARRFDIVLNVVAEADSTQVHKALAARGRVYAVLSEHALGGATQPLRASLIVAPRIRRHTALGITAARPPSPATREVASAIRSIMYRADVSDPSGAGDDGEMDAEAASA